MRLWSLHPELLDRVALVAGWRETLLAQKVLAGQTRGYTRHPQLERFRECDEPLAAIGHYLVQLHDGATARGYNFNRGLILIPDAANPAISITDGQLRFELAHLRAKVRQRDPQWEPQLDLPLRPAASFALTSGPIASWERA